MRPCPADIAQGQTFNADGTYGPATVLTPALSDLAAALARSGSAACAALIAQIMPDAAHQTAFQNAASIINGNSGEAPTAEPLKTKFANLAAAYGIEAPAFAVLVSTVQGAALDVGAALAVLNSACAAATDAAQLNTALAAFETAIGGTLVGVNA